jgi:2-octaprenyl-6-methoxyphenol hydroxylase
MPSQDGKRKPARGRYPTYAMTRVSLAVAGRAPSAHLVRMTSRDDRRFDVAVVGGGATGLAAALIAAIGGFRTVAFAPPAHFPPGRTAALLQGSVDLLAELDVWPALVRHAAPLKAIRIVDATRRLIRAPEATFYASEIGLPAFGFNVPNGDLVAALRRHAEAFQELKIVSAPVQAVVTEEESVLLHAGDEEFVARLVVAADGARSLAREAAGIPVRSWDYRQAALVATLATEQSHRGVSTEFHTESGPFTLVPLPGDRVSLVWVDRPKHAEVSASLDDAAFSRVVSERAQFIHGAMRLDSSPALFPLKAALADRFAARRTVLVGEAAHLFPPIGAQGLNLGFRDVAALKRMLMRNRGDPGAPEALAAYHAARQVDVRTRTLAVDLLNRSLLTDFLPVQAARGIGLALASSVPIVRRALMRRGLGETRLRALKHVTFGGSDLS